MSQPQYSQADVLTMTHLELADELREWGKARQYVSRRRSSEGKEALDAHLLFEAAARLEAASNPKHLLDTIATQNTIIRLRERVALYAWSGAAIGLMVGFMLGVIAAVR